MGAKGKRSRNGGREIVRVGGDRGTREEEDVEGGRGKEINGARGGMRK